MHAAKQNRFRAFIFLSFLLSGYVWAQNTDSLLNVARTSPDSVKIRIYNQLSAALVNSDVKTAADYGAKARDLAVKTGNLKAQAQAWNNIAYAVFYGGQPDSALFIYFNSIKIAGQAGDSLPIIEAYNRIGFIYREKGEPLKSIQYFNAALTSNPGERYKAEAGSAYVNIGVIYNDLGNLKEALRNQQLGLKIYRDIGDKGREANALARIGNVYMDLKNDSAAMRCYQQSKDLFASVNHQRGVAICLNNMAMIYTNQKDYRKALDMYKQARVIRESIGDKNGVALILNNIGSTFLQMDQTDSAIYYIKLSLSITQQLNYKDMTMSNLELLAQSHAAAEDYKLAYQYHVEYHALFDSLHNEEATKQINELNAKFEADKREQQNIQLEQQNKLNEAAIQQQNVRAWFLAAGLISIIVIALLIWRSAIRSKRANVELAQQKKIVEEQHRDILDSISYAQRIQTAVLPTQEEMVNVFPESFVFFKPRDIVSGDFWWIADKGSLRILVVADCTGHGVPGAFMSLIGTTLLNEIVNLKGITNPGKILDELSKGVIAALRQGTGISATKDGMDISICAIDKGNNVLHYAGANNPAWIITTTGELVELRADRQPIGFYDAEVVPFQVQTVAMNTCHYLYLFTDGFADQFGGPAGKKFKYKPLQHVLKANAQLSPENQMQQLDQTFQTWKGELEQIDDVCIVGVKLN